jgi:hypothetical protein
LIQFDPNRPAEAAAPLVEPARVSAFTADDNMRAALKDFKARYVGPAVPQTTGPRRRNIVGCGIGEKSTRNGPTGDLALVAFVRAKLNSDDVPTETLIPKKFGNYFTDVVEVGNVKAFGLGFRETEGPPARCGSSISPRGAPTGTAACLVALQNGKLCILSNNHVLAQCNNGSKGDVIVQAGAADAFNGNKVGYLEDFVRLNFDGSDNEVDAAVAFTSFKWMSPLFHTQFIGSRAVAASVPLAVRKEGRTTGVTTGVVRHTDVSTEVDYTQLGGGMAQLVGQITIQGDAGPFSDEGDSGSLVVTADTIQPVALLVAGGANGITIATPIGTVMDRLNIQRFVTKVES